MKKIKFFSIVLALAISICAFALVACGDKLDEVEEKLLGTWVCPSDNSVYKFTNDGKFSIDGEQAGTFKHDGDGTSNGIYKYSVIVLSYDRGGNKRVYYYESSDHMNISDSASSTTFLRRM